VRELSVFAVGSRNLTDSEPQQFQMTARHFVRVHLERRSLIYPRSSYRIVGIYFTLIEQDTKEDFSLIHPVEASVVGDRIQLQQVILNLITNGIEAMSGVREGSRDLLISSGRYESNGVLVVVRDSGIGLDSVNLDHLFDSFYTTKPDGMGMGLAISRSIVEAHGGRLWATPNAPQGAVFQFTLPPAREKVS
jgi:signal transduction histidine kinase